MREGAKKRLTGAVVIVALAVIFVPMLFEDGTDEPLAPVPATIPDEPTPESRYRTESFLTPADPVVPQPSEETWTESGVLALPEGEAPEPEPFYAEPGFEIAAEEPAPPAATPVTPPPRPAAPVPEPLADGTPSFVTQVASLGSSEGAQQLADKLRGQGFSAFVESAEVRGRTYYRVRVGPDSSRANAERTAARLRQNGNETMVISYP